MSETKLSWYQKNPEKGRAYSNRKRKTTDWRVLLYRNARARAMREELPFTITKEDIRIPEACPLLGVTLQIAEGFVQPNSPTLDQIIPGRGYTPSNVWVISYRANTIKSNLTLDEVKRALTYLKGL